MTGVGKSAGGFGGDGHFCWGGKMLGLIVRFSGMERHTHCIARGVGYLLTFSMRNKFEVTFEEPAFMDYGQSTELGILYSFTFYAKHAVEAKCIHISPQHLGTLHPFCSGILSLLTSRLGPHSAPH